MLRHSEAVHLADAERVTGVKDQLKRLKSTLLDSHHRYWHSSLWNDVGNPNGNKLRTYRLHKHHSTEPESYLRINLHRYERSALAKLRSGTLPLMIETGRYNGTPLVDRRCMCGIDVETECHFLIDCDLHDRYRNILFEKCQNIFDNFIHESSLVKYCLILNEPTLQRTLAKTLVNMLANRHLYL